MQQVKRKLREKKKEKNKRSEEKKFLLEIKLGTLDAPGQIVTTEPRGTHWVRYSINSRLRAKRVLLPRFSLIYKG